VIFLSQKVPKALKCSWATHKRNLGSQRWGRRKSLDMKTPMIGTPGEADIMCSHESSLAYSERKKS
jgi:hypothetical protein